MQEEVVRLVIEAPLADDQVSARFLDLGDHLAEVILLVLVELLIVLLGGNVELQRTKQVAYRRIFVLMALEMASEFRAGAQAPLVRDLACVSPCA